MVFLALIAALLIEQARALAALNPLYGLFRRLAHRLQHVFDGGRYEQGIIAWTIALVPITLVTAAIAALLGRIGAPLELLFSIGVLYLTMGFRQFSHDFTEVQQALTSADLARARRCVYRWRSLPGEELSAEQIARLSIERGLSGAHRYVFGVIAWFAVFGPAGAIFYRLAGMLRESWTSGEPAAEPFSRFSRRAAEWIDWIPVRLTAVSFAVIGDFEDAVYCWRTQAHTWQDTQQGIVLASGAGAIGVRLGGPVGDVDSLDVRPELGMGESADAEIMASTVGLVWRALVLWLFLILLITVANWLG